MNSDMDEHHCQLEKLKSLYKSKKWTMLPLKSIMSETTGKFLKCNFIPAPISFNNIFRYAFSPNALIILLMSFLYLITVTLYEYIYVCTDSIQF